MLSNTIKQALLCFFLLSSFLVHSQKLAISNETIIHEGKERSAIKVVFAPDSKDVKKSFKHYMDDRYDIDVEGIGFLKNKQVIYTEPNIIPSISNQKMELFAKVVGNGKESMMYIFGQIEYNNQITPNTHYTEYGNMRDLTIDFINKLLPNYYQDIVEDQRDEVDDLEEDQKDMRKKLDKNKKKIAELIEENKKLEIKIAENKVKLEQNIKVLGEKKATLKEVNTKIDKVKN